MKRFFRGGLLLLLVAGALTGCGNRETKKALQAARVLEDQKQCQDADDVLVEALRKREEEIRAKLPVPSDPAETDDDTRKVQADPEILKMEREQIGIYLHLDRPDLASAVYSDILAGAPGDPVVIEFLKDKDKGIRSGAVRVLGLAGKAEAIGGLSDAAKDPDQDIRRAAVAALGSIKDANAVPPLIEALKDSYWFVRSDAAEALARERDARAVDPLFGLIDDPDKTVESSAENSLVALSGDKEIPLDPFAARLNSPDMKTAIVAAVCLSVRKDARAAPVLIQLAQKGDASVRLHAVKALGEAGDASAFPILRQLLQDPDTNVRGWSIIGLGKLNDTASIPELKAIAADANQSASIREAATDVVAHMASLSAGATAPAAPAP